MEPGTDQAKESFFSSLFDFSFKSYITPRIIQVIFKIAVVVSALLALVFAIAAFSSNVIVGVFVLIIVAPLLFLLYVISYRVILEVVMAVFAIAENTRQLAGPEPASVAAHPIGRSFDDAQPTSGRGSEQSSPSAVPKTESASSAPPAASEPADAASGSPTDGAAQSAASTPEAGWYQDPGDPSKQRWWEGEGWSDHVRQP